MKDQKIQQKIENVEIGSVARALRSLNQSGGREQIMNLNAPGTKRISAQQFRDMRRAVRLRERPFSEPGQ